MKAGSITIKLALQIIDFHALLDLLLLHTNEVIERNHHILKLTTFLEIALQQDLLVEASV